MEELRFSKYWEEPKIAGEHILTAHAVFGVLGILAALWVFVEILNANGRAISRTFYVSAATAVFMWLSFLLGGYWYVSYYPADRALLLAGPRPWAHSLVMESKEHLFFIVLLLSTYLPITVNSLSYTADTNARRLALTVAGSTAILGLVMEWFGSIISMGVRMGLCR